MVKPHLFHRATVSRIIKETADARTYVLAPGETPFPYRAGQFCTFKVHVNGEDLYRSYSMSSAPETDSEMATTVKRVPGGKVSNWMLDNLVEGDEVTITRAAGTFCLTDTSVPVLGFGGGSGVTPILSLVKSALSTTHRKVRRFRCFSYAEHLSIESPRLRLPAFRHGELHVIDGDDAH